MKKRFVDRRIKNRYLIYIILCSFCLGSLLGVIVHPVSAITNNILLCNWDDVAAGLDTGTSGYFNFKNVGTVNYFETSTDYDLSVPHSMKVTGATGAGFLNLTSSFSYITNINFSFYYSPAINTDVYMYFRNGSGNLITLWWSTPSTKLVWYSISGGWTTLSTTAYVGARYYMNISYNGTNSFNVKIKNATFVTKANVDVAGAYAGNWNNFTHIYMTSDAAGALYLDNFRISYSTGSMTSENCGYDMSDHQSNSIGLLDATQFSSDKYIESLYNLPLSTTIFGVSLSVTGVQHTYASDLVNYTLKINGLEIGNPVCFSKTGETLYDDIYSLFWDMTVTLSDEPLLMEFYHSEKITGTSYYWDLYKAFNPYNFERTLEHSSGSLYDGNYNGVNKHTFYSVIRFYYDTILFENETSPYSDLVTCPKTAYSTFDTIPLSFFVSDFTYSNSIQLWRNGTQKTDAIQGFPYSVLTGDFYGELSYTPLLSGKYQFRLVRNGLIKSTFNVTVTNPVDMDFVLAVYPNPCDFNTEVFVFFRFYPSDGADGFIGVSEFPDTSGFSSFDESWALSANTTGNKSFFPQTNMYVSLWKKSGNASYVRLVIKYLKMYSLFDNTINVGYKSIALSDAVPSVSQHIYGTQVVQGFNTFVRMNNKLLQYVTDTPFYDVYVDVSKGGNYNVELCMETANGSIVLCSVNFMVSSPAAGGGAGADVFPAEMKLLFGICCILVAISCPLMISVKYHVAVPTFVYVVFMAFGIGIGTVLGFLELWLVFLFVVALVAGAVFTIFGHGGSGGGGGGGDSGTIRKGGILSRRVGKDYARASRKADYGVSPKGSPGYLKGPGRRGY